MVECSSEVFNYIFGASTDSIEIIESRAVKTFGGDQCIVWEGDPETFKFLYVSKSAETLLGYPSTFWLNDSFWAKTVVHPSDRSDAIAYCALATGKGRDHDFVYRAVKADGSTVLLHDVVKVVRGTGIVPFRLRGLMFPVADASVVIPIFDRLPLPKIAS